MQELASEIASKLNIRAVQAEAVLEMLGEGATIPFIARYRKDRTGNLDEVQILKIQDEAGQLKEFNDRKAFIEKAIMDQGKMTEELRQKLNGAHALAELEDIYLPFKPKRKTRAQAARENGLGPLAAMILEQREINLEAETAKYFNEKLTSLEDALQGARDIIAEQVSEDGDTRARLRKLFEEKASLGSKVVEAKEQEAIKFKDYFNYSEPVMKVPSHRALAVLRGFVEGFLRVSIEPPEEQAVEVLERAWLKGMNSNTEQVRKALKDSYRRLLQPALETEFRTALKLRSDEEAINVFAENLRQLLLSSPLGSKRILAIDPGYRTGCKIVCLDEQGALKKTSLIFIHEPGRLREAEEILRGLVESFQIQAFAIGDGTAGRETEQLVKKLNLGLPVFMVNEDGASVYSASETAREEFPDQDITVRGAVSIGRRLMDPLAELVKIDPKSIGVGQYQHDVNQFRLKEKLDQTVVSCVNQVGVNLNTASRHLLAYVSGIGTSLAENMVRYRAEIGSFRNREQILKVPRLGSKAYEQCAGFLRIKDGDHPLDQSAVHPEAYGVVARMATDLGVEIRSLIGNDQLIKQINPKKYVSGQTGELTIRDILKELSKPGLDPRKEVQQFEFAEIYSMADVVAGMVVPGIVTNLTRFGAFVDIGVKQDGLVHISEIAHRYIEDPNEVLHLNEKVMVKVLEVDTIRKRIALSIRQAGESAHADERSKTKKRVLPPGEEKRKAGEAAGKNLDDALSRLKQKFRK